MQLNISIFLFIIIIIPEYTSPKFQQLFLVKQTFAKSVGKQTPSNSRNQPFCVLFLIELPVFTIAESIAYKYSVPRSFQFKNMLHTKKHCKHNFYYCCFMPTGPNYELSGTIPTKQ